MMTVTPIGTIHTPFTDPKGMPIQPTGGAGVKGRVTLFEQFQPGLRDLEGFSHLILLYWFHQSEGFELEVVPFMDTQSRGLFATRAPKRPNPIGLSIVELVAVEGGVLHIQNIDVLDQTPLLDIKPYVPAFDQPQAACSGWLQAAEENVVKTQADDRFAP